MEKFLGKEKRKWEEKNDGEKMSQSLRGEGRRRGKPSFDADGGRRKKKRGRKNVSRKEEESQFKG